ncbi:hypothetical protein FB451DRAFT_1190649 [Mycena latifolia]|nr:hypothetical protein FB451DRAFT_1190649 [Mycena latifolia]
MPGLMDWTGCGRQRQESSSSAEGEHGVDLVLSVGQGEDCATDSESGKGHMEIKRTAPKAARSTLEGGNMGRRTREWLRERRTAMREAAEGSVEVVVVGMETVSIRPLMDLKRALGTSRDYSERLCQARNWSDKLENGGGGGEGNEGHGDATIVIRLCLCAFGRRCEVGEGSVQQQAWSLSAPDPGWRGERASLCGSVWPHRAYGSGVLPGMQSRSS